MDSVARADCSLLQQLGLFVKHRNTPLLVAITEKQPWFKSSHTLDKESPINEDLTTSYHIHDLFALFPVY